MPQPVNYGPIGSHVNVLKKVRTNGGWRLCPAVREPNGRLRDRVRVNGTIESHREGVYYLEWREEGRRRRQAVPNPAEVLERARLKSLELESRRLGIPATGKPEPPIARDASIDFRKSHPIEAPIFTLCGGAEQLLLNGIAAYVRETVEMALRVYWSSPGRREGTSVEICESDSEEVKLLATPVQSKRAQSNELAPDIRLERPASSGDDETTVAEAIEAYLKNIEPPQREPKTYEKYRSTLYRFRDACKKTKAHEIDRDDCLEFMRQLYAAGNEARTVHNLISIVQQWLKSRGITGLLHGRDKPVFVANMRHMYQPEDLKQLFQACRPDEKIRYLFFLLTGERDQEVRHTTWSDIDFNRRCVRVTTKRQMGFKPKDKEEREIPVPASLLDALREYKLRQSGINRNDLVFPTSKGRPDKKFESKLKKIAFRAGLNCGYCNSRHGNKCSEGPYCSKWFLHKFRHTFATTSLEEGVSIRTLQAWLGHSDLASTMVYLKYVGRQRMHEIIDRSAMAELASNAFQAMPATDVEVSDQGIRPNT